MYHISAKTKSPIHKAIILGTTSSTVRRGSIAVVVIITWRIASSLILASCVASSALICCVPTCAPGVSCLRLIVVVVGSYIPSRGDTCRSGGSLLLCGRLLGIEAPISTSCILGGISTHIPWVPSRLFRILGGVSLILSIPRGSCLLLLWLGTRLRVIYGLNAAKDIFKRYVVSSLEVFWHSRSRLRCIKYSFVQGSILRSICSRLYLT